MEQIHDYKSCTSPTLALTEIGEKVRSGSKGTTSGHRSEG
jgi:hypothetical protein